MALSDFFDTLGTNLTKASPEAWFALSDSLINRKGLAGGINAFAREAQQGRKRQGMADALQGMMGDLTPQQRQFLSVADPEAAMSVLGTKLFGGGSGKNWKVVDSDNDGLPDYQIEEGSGKIEAHPLTASDRIRTALGVQNIPGLGSVDKFGNPVGPIGPGAASPQLRPAITTEVAPTSSPAAAAEFGGEPGKGAALAPPPAVVTATPTKTPTPSTTGKMVVPIPLQQLGAFGLPTPGQGSRWVRDFDAKSRQWSQPRQESVEGAVDKTKEIPGELVARLGLATSFFKDADYVVKKIEEGATTGPSGQINLALSRGDAGKVWRIASDGSDAMQRMLTGAGMPAAEATNYVARFLPTFGDSKATQLDKVQNLTRRLKAIAELSARGRMTNEEIFRLTGVTEVGSGSASDAAPGSEDEHSDVDKIIGLPKGPAGGPLLDGPPTMQPGQSSFAAPDDVMLAQGGGTASMAANGLGMAPRETLAQIGRRGPRMLSPQMAGIEAARENLTSNVDQGGRRYEGMIARLKAEWKRDKAKVMASPEYKFLKQTGLLHLLELGG